MQVGRSGLEITVQITYNNIKHGGTIAFTNKVLEQDKEGNPRQPNIPSAIDWAFKTIKEEFINKCK